MTDLAPERRAPAALSNANAARPLLLQLAGIAWAALLALAMLAGHFGAGHGSATATVGRMGASVALVVSAWYGCRLWRQTSAGTFIAFVALGMTLGALGDFYNAELLNPIAPLGNPVLGGMISFGLGHIAYIVACLIAAQRGALGHFTLRCGALATWLAVATVGWYWIVYLADNDQTRDLVWPALPYSLLLASTAGVATGLALVNTIFRPLAVGATLFFVSDMILACGLFRGSLPYQTEQVWLTYSPGQMLIVFGALAACRFLAGHSATADSAPVRAGAGG